MKKRKSTLITSQADAAKAFAHGINLTKSQRERVVMQYFKAQADVSLERACTVAIKYGLGLLDEVGAALTKLTLAWLRIGEQAWRKIVAKAQNFDWISISYSRLCKKLRNLFLRYKPAWAW